jgi:hypothetical protein
MNKDTTLFYVIIDVKQKAGLTSFKKMLFEAQ